MTVGLNRIEGVKVVPKAINHVVWSQVKITDKETDHEKESQVGVDFVFEPEKAEVLAEQDESRQENN